MDKKDQTKKDSSQSFNKGDLLLKNNLNESEPDTHKTLQDDIIVTGKKTS